MTCPPSYECGSVPDGCGGVVDCVATATTAPAVGPNTTTTCVPFAECPEGVECGSVPDGCGGEIECGGECSEGLYCAEGNMCQCEPPPCDGRCGFMNNGCGDETACFCNAAEEYCDEEVKLCKPLEVPLPPEDIFNEP